jgi:hypothetical protein
MARREQRLDAHAGADVEGAFDRSPDRDGGEQHRGRERAHHPVEPAADVGGEDERPRGREPDERLDAAGAAVDQAEPRHVVERQRRQRGLGLGSVDRGLEHEQPRERGQRVAGRKPAHADRELRHGSRHPLRADQPRDARGVEAAIVEHTT